MNPIDDNDRVAGLLQQALREEAETVEVDPGALHAIRSRLAPKRRHGWWIAGSGAGLATAAAVTTVVLLASPGSTPSGAPAGQGDHHGATHQAHQTRPTPTAPTAVTDSPQTGPMIHTGRFVPGQPGVTMYYLDLTTPTPDGGLQLYVEPHTVSGSAAAVGPAWTGAPSSDEEALVAVQEFLTSTPIDPQYSSGWPTQVGADAVQRSGDTTTIALSGRADLGPSTCEGCQALALAVQALARTAGLQDGDKLALTYNGKPLESVFGLALPVTVQPMENERAYVQITSPVDSQTLTAPVTITGDGNVFEGTVSWELSDAAGSTVKQGTEMTAQGEWRPFTIDLGDLPAGQYTIRCYEASAKDGSVLYVDDKVFTVQ